MWWKDEEEDEDYIECQMFSLASFDLNKLEMQEREKILEPLWKHICINSVFFMPI